MAFSTVTFSANSSGSNGSERWQYDAAGDQPTFTVTGSTTLDVIYYDQLDDTFSVSTAAGGTPMSTTNDITASYTQFNGAVSQPIYDGSPATEWADRASTVSFSANSSGSSSTERWQYNAHGAEPTFTVSDNTPLAATYYDQVSQTFSATTKNGTPLSSSNYVTAQYAQFGSSVDSTAAIYDQHDLTDWADVGSTATLDQQSSGSGSSERWESQAQPTQTVTSPASPLNGNYFDQLAETFQATTASGGTPMSASNDITASYIQFNGGLTQPIYDGTTAAEWADRASTVTFSANSSGSSSTERWQYNAHGA